METGDFHRQTTDGSGTSRDYEVRVPASYDPNKPLALTFVYHQSGGSEASAIAFGLQTAPGAADASIFVYPQGINYESYGIGWNDACSGYDMPFFSNMLSELESSYCIDPNRVFAAGFSWGCDYVTALACCRGANLRAVAVASCSDDFSNPADYTTYFNKTCSGTGNTGIRFTYDPGGDVGYTAQEFSTTINLYQSFDGCSSSTTATNVSPCVSHQGCKTAPLLTCPYPGLGHNLPSSWPGDTWNFFSTFQ